MGAFPWAMKMLRDSGLVDTIREEARKKPFLGICLGMQLIFDKGYEFEETDGLRLIGGKFETLKRSLADIGVTGITVTQVLGCGTQRGAAEYYRGTPVEPSLLPKVKVDVVVCKVPVETVITTARKALYSGHIGDGKIFVYNVEDVVRVRTGEVGYDALQDNEED